MLKKFLLVITLLGFKLCLGQNDEKISINFNNIPISEALIKLEEQTNLHFYFDTNWLKGLSVNKSYNENLITILDDLFKDTTINYFIYNNQVILSNNSIIYSSLPAEYFSNSNKGNNNSVVFYNQYSSDSNQNDDVITIGKQLANNPESSFKLKGYVKNVNTDEPVINLTIRVKDKNIYTSTNENGYYEIDLPTGLNELETSLIGFDQVSLKFLVYGNGSYNFNVSENAEQLQEVVITAEKEDNVRSATVGVTKLDVEGIKTIPVVFGERDILRVATSLPGIKTAGEGSAGYNVRGGRTDQNLILLDDGVLYNPSHFLGLFTALNPFTTGNVEIYKASIPSEFGGRLSSVFDIETKNSNTSEFTGQGSIGPVTANLALETPIVKEKSSLVTGIRATYSDWILRSLDEESLKNSQASFYDAIVNYKHRINEKNSIQTSIYYSKDKFSITSDSIYKYQNFLTSLKWKLSLNEKNSGEIILVNSNYKFNIDYNGISNSDFDFGYDINETEFKINMQYSHSKAHKFNYGISSKYYLNNPGQISPSNSSSDIEAIQIEKERGLESAVFVSDLFNVSDKLLLDIGLRYSFYSAMGKATQNVYENGQPRNETTVIDVRNYESGEVIKTYGGLESRLSFRYFIDPTLSLKGGYNKTYQYIHLLSSNTTQSPLDTWQLSDLNVKPQNADQFAIGLFKNLDDSNVEISLEGYYKKMNNILDYKVGANLVLNENIETELLQGEGKAYGVELLIKKKSGRLNGWFGYTYSRSFVKLDSDLVEEQVNNGDYFPANYDKPHDLSVVMNYKFTKRYSVSANFVYQTGRPITYPLGKYEFANQEQVFYSDRNKFRIPDYYRLDIGVNIEGNHKIKKLAHSFWNISIYNVLGRNNPYSVFFINENGQIKAYQTSIFSIPVPTITYNFKF